MSKAAGFLLSFFVRSISSLTGGYYQVGTITAEEIYDVA